MILEFALNLLLTVIAVALGFGCALTIATVLLRSIISAITRNSYNTSGATIRNMGPDVRLSREAAFQ